MKKQTKAVYATPSFYNGRVKVYKMELDTCRKKPRIHIHDELEGRKEAKKLCCKIKRGARSTKVSTPLKGYKADNLLTLFKRLTQGDTNEFTLSIVGNNLPYWVHLLTIEFDGEAFYLSQTVQTTKTTGETVTNQETTYLAKVTEYYFVEKSPYGYETLAALWGMDVVAWKRYLQEAVRARKAISVEASPQLLPHHEWAKQFGVALEYGKGDVQEKDTAFHTIREGIQDVQQYVDLSKYNKLTILQLAPLGGSHGKYYYRSGRLAFIPTLNEKLKYVVYHELGHVIYYSLLNKQLQGEEVATQNGKILREFLKTQKNCSYIRDVIKVEDYNLSYYQSDTELFSRFFEAYMLYALNADSDMFSEVHNTREEVQAFQQQMQDILPLPTLT